MNEYSHHVSGFFAVCDEAKDTLDILVARGLPPGQLRIYETDVAPSAPVPKEDSNAVLKDVLVDGAIGTAVGTGLGALAEVALVAASVTLFVASPAGNAGLGRGRWWRDRCVRRRNGGPARGQEKGRLAVRHGP